MTSSFQLVDSLRRKRVREFVDNAWKLVVGCSTCGARRDFLAAELGRRFPADVTAGDILDRLVCRCAGRDGVAHILQSTSELQARDVARFNAEDKYVGLNAKTAPGRSQGRSCERRS